MKPSELVVGQRYSVKVLRKQSRRGDNGFRITTYIGITPGNEDIQEMQFRISDHDIACLYPEDLAMKVKAADRKAATPSGRRVGRPR